MFGRPMMRLTQSPDAATLPDDIPRSYRHAYGYAVPVLACVVSYASIIGMLSKRLRMSGTPDFVDGTWIHSPSFSKLSRSRLSLHWCALSAPLQSCRRGHHLRVPFPRASSRVLSLYQRHSHWRVESVPLHSQSLLDRPFIIVKSTKFEGRTACK